MGSGKGRKDVRRKRDIQTEWISRGFVVNHENPYYEISRGKVGEGVAPPADAVDVHRRPIAPVSPETAKAMGYERKFRSMRAACRLCVKSFSLRKDVGASVSWKGAKLHLQNTHGVTDAVSLDEALQRAKSQGEGVIVESGILAYMAPHKPGSPEYNKCVDALARMIAVENMPFHLGERPGFVKFMRTVSARFPRIPATALTRRLVRLAKESRERLGRQLAKIQAETDIAWTADMWTSRSGQAFMTYSGHWIDSDWNLKFRVMGTDKFSERHTADNISERLEKIRAEFQLNPIEAESGYRVPSKVLQRSSNISKFFDAEHYIDRPSITTDCGADISCGVEVGERWDWNKCVCHILHNGVREGLKVPGVQKVVTNVRALAVNMRKSRLAWEHFQRCRRVWQ